MVNTKALLRSYRQLCLDNPDAGLERIDMMKILYGRGDNRGIDYEDDDIQE
jgi:hypothetical protein